MKLGKTALLVVVGVAAARVLRRKKREAPPGSEETGEILRGSRVARALDPFSHLDIGAPVPPPLPEGRVVSVPGRGEMFVRTLGDGPGIPVLLLHGWMASADLNWYRLYEELAGERPVIACDHRGHGRGIRSPHRFTLEACADDAAALLEMLGIERAIVVGYSMGGPIATLFAARHPEKAAGLVLEATALEWHESRFERARWRLMGVLSVMLRWQAGRLMLARIMGDTGEVSDVILEHRSWLEGEFRRSDPSDLADAGRALSRYDGRPQIAQVSCPIAVVITTSDTLVPPHKQRVLADAADAEVFEFDGDHDSAIVHSEGFAKVTQEAINSVAEPASPR
ncbi:MAG: alpha/beta fold hydrolase [Actinobacteria bacterium]|nr:alpha/beta fold hydrolase [Actinomycetota bacterium]